MQLIDDSRGATTPDARPAQSDEAAIYLEGVVVEGQQLARKLGFPTANVELSAPHPRFGSYAARTRLADGRVIRGVANVGRNPTTGLVKPRLEVWLFDFNEDLYGQTIRTELVAFLRPEQKFDDLLLLVVQVLADADQAQAVLKTPAEDPSDARRDPHWPESGRFAEPKRRRGAA